MKIFFQSIIIACTALIVFSTSCKKSENAQPAPTVSETEPANLQNPYDSFGYWHNIILDSIEQHRTAGRTVNFDRSYDFIRKFYRMMGWPELPKGQFASVPKTVNDAVTDMYALIDQSKWSDSVKENLSQLITQMQQLAADSCSYPKLKKAVAQFEDRVLQCRLPNADKEVVLKVASLARHSSFRWMQHGDMQEPYRNSSMINAKFLGGFGRWIAVTMADIGGAVAELSIANAAACSDYMSQVVNY